MIKTEFANMANRKQKRTKRKAKFRTVLKVTKGIFLGTIMFTLLGIVGRMDMEATETETVTIKPEATETYIKTGTYWENTVVTDDGEEWEYDMELPVGTKVNVTFDQNGTSTVYDDIIIDITERKGN